MIEVMSKKETPAVSAIAEPLASPEIKSDKNVLNKFVTRMWEHPLLTDETRNKRETALTYLREKFPNLQEIILIPVGSSVWITDDESDVDFVLIHTPKANRNEIHTIDTVMENSREDANVPSLHMVSHQEFSDILNYESELKNLANAFFTPDEYCVGDLNLLKEIRIRTLDLNSYSPKPYSDEDLFEVYLPHTLKLNFIERISWPIKRFSSSMGTHYPRFMNALMKRAFASHFPERYPVAFHESMTNLWKLKYEEIVYALQQNAGEIHIDVRYKAKSLESKNT